MDMHTFDRWTVALAHRPSRRAALRLMIGGLLGGATVQGRLTPVFAQRPDRDGDGLYDDDETDVYGTNPDVFDTDGDGTGDGEEIYNRDNGLGGPSDPLTPEGGAPPPQGGDVDCTVYPEHCGIVQRPRAGAITDAVVCPAGLNQCPGSGCVNMQQDPANCGFCGYDCGDRNYHFCYLGNCVDYCETGTRRCTGEIFCRSYNEPCPGE